MGNAMWRVRIRPYVMRERAYVPERPTVDDPPDRRIERPFPRRLSLAQIRAITRPGATDPRLRPADWWLQRWAVTHGSGEVLPLAATVSLVPRSPPARVSVLDDAESLL